MKAQSINRSGICSIRPPPPASRQAHPTGRGASRAAEHYPQNKTPQIAGSCQAHRTAGIGGIGAIRARLVNVSRASSKKVQKSLAGFKSYPQVACTADIPSRRSRRCGWAVLVDHGTEAGRAKFESYILLLTPAPTRRQYFASRVSAGRADISDEPLHFLERLNPGHLLHRGLTPWTADHVLLSGIRHNKPQLSSPKLKLVNARTYPLYSEKVLTKFFAAMPIRSRLGGQQFDPETIRLMGIASEMARCSLQRTDGSINPTRAAVAQKIIELAKAGERDPERLCEGALKATQPVIPVLISHPVLFCFPLHRRCFRVLEFQPVG